jgi:rfaE bifunctional protein kinase chain/domain
MRLPPLDNDRARELISRFAGVQVLVVGDAMLDRFIVGRVTRISPEAPVPVVLFQSEHVRLGGAANVAHNVLALGGRASLVAIVGRDAAGERLKQLLTTAGAATDGLVEDPSRPTIEKVRIVTERNQQVARVDYEHDGDVDPTIELEVVGRVRQLGPEAGAFLVSDYLKGAITRTIVGALVDLGRGSVPLVVDPKIPHLGCYAGATLITPNHQEAEIGTHLRIRTDEEARDAAREFRRRAECDAVLITRGERGMWLTDSKTEGAVPAVAHEVSDVTGAGDTVVATLALSLAAGATKAEAAILANHAAGIVVGKFGPATVTRSELLTAFDSG